MKYEYGKTCYNCALYNECLDQLHGKGHVLSSGCEIAYGTPIESIKQMVKSSKNFNF